MFVNVDENGSVSGGGRIGCDFGPHAHASVGVDIDSKRNVSTSVNGHYERDTMKYDGQVSLDQT